MLLRPEAGRRGLGFLDTATRPTDMWRGGSGNCHSVGGTWSVVPDRGWGSWGLNCAVRGPVGGRGSRGRPRGLSFILHFAFIAASQLVMANKAALLLAHLLRLCPRLLLSRSEDPVEDNTPVVHQRGDQEYVLPLLPSLCGDEGEGRSEARERREKLRGGGEAQEKGDRP